VLNLDAALGRELVARAVMVRAEGDASLRERAAPGQRHDLVAAGIGEDGARPAHEGVEAAQPGDALGTGAEHEVVGVAQHDLGTRGGQHVDGQRLDGGSRADGHEGGGLDRAEGGREAAAAGGTVAGEELEGKGHARSMRQASP
jgi:hypothetical protein